MKYTLTVLTHGDSETLEDCLESFGEHVRPLPDRVMILRDGPGYSYIPRWTESFACVQIAPQQIGFCRATAKAWRVGVASKRPYVFHLEHDFVFLRHVDLRELASVLDSDHRVAQLALVRGPANPEERAAGGLIEARPGQFRRELDNVAGPWLRHRSFWTTNPSLIRRSFMVENPWPMDGHPECEGRFGIELVKRGYEFGYWGLGEPMVDHIGRRTGFGY